ncbi:Tetratricopeptide repeat-containing protein [Singulisphaera sp. GP187]|uniref:tetratricopeptide repeat protein n=1 Tax=Singulisphaera sp. GP187 TaxID=1882752 RepID=UPI0009265771|nr:tetratricopeptide repeat protein [Singulisphaera sp. GP187]SIO58573.1 Tetratricopeptide repeat-containing protein [Singulisphaera sp. GP187]
MRRFRFSITAASVLLAVALAGVPAAFARGGGGGGHGGGFGGGGFHGGGFGGGGFHGGGFGGGGFRGGGFGGGGFRGGGFGGGGFRAPSSIAPRTFSAPMGGFRGGNVMRAPAMGGSRIQNFSGARGFQPGRASVGTRAPVANLGNRAGVGNFRSFGNRSPVANFGNRTGMGNFRSFGNPGFAGVNRVSSINNVNRTNIVSNRSQFNNFGGRGFGRFGRGFGFGWGFFPFGWGGWWFPWGFGLGYGLGGYGYGGYGYGGYGNWGYPYGYGYDDYGYAPTSWLYGGSLYGYGYSPYSNPYYDSLTGVAVDPYNYALPINTGSAPPADAAADEAVALFGSARDSFKEGSFAAALQQADAALVKSPNDTSLHEFRALCLFALGRYDESATVLYAVLSVGPGWDWPTLIGLYPNIDVYTTQQRALEAYCNANPQSSSARFVLGYHYLTQGHIDAAASTLKQVVALKPSDTLSAKLLETLESVRKHAAAGGTEAVQPSPAPASVPAVNTALPEGATISGAWTVQPSPDTSVSLTIQADGAFHWQVAQKGQTREFAGHSNFGGGILTLVPDKGLPIVGRVSWTDPSHMTFRVIGDRPDAPGLSFTK